MPSNTRRKFIVGRPSNVPSLHPVVNGTVCSCFISLTGRSDTRSKMAERSQFELEREARVKANKLKMQVIDSINSSGTA